MGAGNRVGIPVFKVLDIFKTQNDGLARVLRKKLRERQIKSLDVVACDEVAQQSGQKKVGSIAYYPAMCGIVLGAFVTNRLVDKE